MISSFLSEANRPIGDIAFMKPAITTKEIKSVLNCIFNDEISCGKVVRELETECARVFGFRNALVVSSLHSAYHLALLVSGLETDNEVIIPSLASLSILDAIGYLGAKPVIVDIARDSFHPDVNTVIDHITEKTKIIVLPYQFGSFKNYSDLYHELKTKYSSIKLIEDISGIPGASFAHKQIGTNADITILGFEQNMPITMGKGAVLLTNSESIHHLARNLCNPRYNKNQSYRVRYDYTITDYQAAIGVEQLHKLPLLGRQRKKIAGLYLHAVGRSQLKTFFRYPEADGYGSFPVISSKDTKQTMVSLKKENIETRRALEHEPLHTLASLSSLNFPNSEKLYQKGVLLPIYPHLTQECVNRVAMSIKKIE